MKQKRRAWVPAAGSGRLAACLMTMTTTTAPRSATRVRRSTWEAGARPERKKWKKAETPAADLGQQDGAAELTLTEIDAGSGVGHGQLSGGGQRRVGSGSRW